MLALGFVNRCVVRTDRPLVTQIMEWPCQVPPVGSRENSPGDFLTGLGRRIISKVRPGIPVWSPPPGPAPRPIHLVTLGSFSRMGRVPKIEPRG